MSTLTTIKSKVKKKPCKCKKKPILRNGKYYLISEQVSALDREMMCDMVKEHTNVYDVRIPKGKVYLYIGHATKADRLMMIDLLKKGFKVIRVDGKPPGGCGSPGHPC